MLLPADKVSCGIKKQQRQTLFVNRQTEFAGFFVKKHKVVFCGEWYYNKRKVWVGKRMNFTEIANNRYSCRRYDSKRPVEAEKLQAVLESAVLSPSACNGQPYHITVCRGEAAKQAARGTKHITMNAFVDDAPVLLVISEEPYSKMAAMGAKIKHNDYRSMDIGILSAYITAEATAQGLGTCIIGWLDSEKLRQVCGVAGTVRLVITLGYPLDEPRQKKRKGFDELVSFKD